MIDISEEELGALSDGVIEDVKDCDELVTSFLEVISLLFELPGNNGCCGYPSTVLDDIEPDISLSIILDVLSLTVVNKE